MKRITPTDLEKMHAYRRRGFTFERIGHFLGWSRSAVARRLKGVSVPPERRAGYPSMKSRVLRQQALFDACNRAIAEVRA